MFWGEIEYVITQKQSNKQELKSSFISYIMPNKNKS